MALLRNTTTLGHMKKLLVAGAVAIGVAYYLKRKQKRQDDERLWAAATD